MWETVACCWVSQTCKASGKGSGAALDGDVATDQPAAFSGQAAVHGGAQRADAGDGADTQGKARQHDTHAADAAAQVAQGQAGREPPI